MKSKVVFKGQKKGTEGETDSISLEAENSSNIPSKSGEETYILENSFYAYVLCLLNP